MDRSFSTKKFAKSRWAVWKFHAPGESVFRSGQCRMLSYNFSHTDRNLLWASQVTPPMQSGQGNEAVAMVSHHQLATHKSFNLLFV